MLSAIRPDPVADMVVELAADGTSATCRQRCQAERSMAFAGDTTMERMARFQGQVQASVSTPTTLELALERVGSGWVISSMHVA
jgi:hypothetical protein